jgi:Tol biopolymer transport system component
MDADGTNARQLTFDGPNYNPTLLPDGKWVVYESVRGGNWALWKVSIEGGEPVRLTDKPSRRPSVSPDGKLLACYYDGGIALLPAEGGTPIKTFKLPRYATFSQVVRWTPDGQALMFRDVNQGVWRQAIAGGAPVHLTDFGPELIFNLAWSPDGKQLAVARGTQSFDVVLIRDLK